MKNIKKGLKHFGSFLFVYYMNFKVNFKPYPGANYFTFQEHQKSFDSKVHKNTNEYLGQIKKHLISLFNISSEFRFEIYDKSKMERLLSQVKDFVLKDDPISGMENLIEGKHVNNEISLLDLSYSFPHVQHDFTSFDAILIDPIVSLGIPIRYILVFSKMKFPDIKNSSEDHKNAAFAQDIFLLHRVLRDYAEKGKEMLLRESNYKVAVLNQMIESSNYLKYDADKKYRSKTMFSAECELKFLEELEKIGFEVGIQRIDQKFKITIANYPTHSKELIEMFSDRIAAF